MPASSLLEFIAIDILGPLPRTADGIQYVSDMTERLPKLTRALPAGRKSSAFVTNVFFNPEIGCKTVVLESQLPSEIQL